MLEWYGYKHVNGTIHVRRFLGDHGDIAEAKSSPFVDRVYGPFYAQNQHAARAYLTAVAA